MKLLKSQKNELFDIIEEAGLSPSSFQIKEYVNKAKENITDINVKDTDLFFRIGGDVELIEVTFAPGEKFYTSEEENPDNWDEIVNLFHIWIPLVKVEILADDKWQRLTEEIKHINVSYANDSGRFSALEYEDLKDKMGSLKERVKSLSLSKEQLTTLENKLDHLTEIAKTLNKFDWKGLFVGTIVSVVIQMSITPDTAKSLWQLIKSIFTNYFLP